MRNTPSIDANEAVRMSASQVESNSSTRARREGHSGEAWPIVLKKTKRRLSHLYCMGNELKGSWDGGRPHHRLAGDTRPVTVTTLTRTATNSTSVQQKAVQ